MSFLIWQAGGDVRIASPRLVLRAAEVPLLKEAQQLCARLSALEGGARERIAAAASEAAAQGHAQGLEEGRRAGQDEVARTLLALAQAAHAERERVRREIAALALQVVRKMLGRHADDALLAALADTAAAEAVPSQPVTVVVHPDLCDAVRERLAARAEPDAARFDVRGDPACTHQTCRLETAHGSVDASVEAQLARLAQAWAVQVEGGAA